MSDKIKLELEKIEIPKELHNRAKLGVMQAKSEKPKSKLKKLMFPVVASLTLMFSAGVGAAYIPSLNNLLANVSPEIALMLQPIDSKSGISESNGIKMEVVAAMNDDEMAVIYVTMQDLIGDRIDETLDLYDYSFTGAHMNTSQLVDYDETSNTATLRIQANGGEELDGSKVNFRIDSFLSDKQTHEVEVEADLAEIINNPPKIIPLDMNNTSGGGGVLLEQLEAQKVIQVLKPSETNIQLPGVDFINITNIGFIDDRLHIQVEWTGNDIDAHGYFYFVDELGNEIYSSSVNFGLDGSGKTNYGNEYTEYIFEKNSMDVDEQELLGHFVSNGNHIEGDWNTTFRLQSVGEKLTYDFKKDFGTWTSNSVSISPLGVTLYGSGKFNESTQLEVDVIMNDGSVQTLDFMTGFIENEEVIVKFLSPLPLDLSKVKSINIDDTEIDL